MGLLTGPIFAPVATSVGREVALVLFVVFIICCCFGAVDTLATDVGFDVVVACRGIDDDTIDVGGVAVVVFFIVLGIPHICDSVVLTTFRLGLLGSHNFAFTWRDIGLLGELLLSPRLPGVDEDNDVNCCANT